MSQKNKDNLKAKVIFNSNRRGIKSKKEEIGFSEYLDYIRTLFNDPVIGERVKELEERETNEVVQGEISERLINLELYMKTIEEKLNTLQREIGMVRRNDIFSMNSIDEMKVGMEDISQRVKNLELYLDKSQNSFYRKLAKAFDSNEVVKLLYTQERAGNIDVTIFCNDSIANSNEEELKVYETFDAVCSEFSNLEIDLLVLVYNEEREIPKDANIIIKSV